MRDFRDQADADLAALLHEEMRDCLRRYEERKQEAGALDFLDLLIKARDLVLDNQDVCREFRERFRVILVDEFQDTDPLQAELLLALTGADDGTIRPGALFIVGDPKQSIYRFRRADVGAYRRIADRLSGSGATAVTLQTSFRSVPAIQHFVNASFRDDMNGDVESLQADYVPLLATSRGHGRTAVDRGAAGAAPVRQEPVRPAASHADGAQRAATAGDCRVRRLAAVAGVHLDGRERQRRGGGLSPAMCASCSGASCTSARTSRATTSRRSRRAASRTCWSAARRFTSAKKSMRFAPR